ncbi:hypothetical protein EHM69_12970 [candidate division KSB1 bacterium]|nr:MAG: hypothetical protein EHM69_12970 [candidate division KSB1 bacterium]
MLDPAPFKTCPFCKYEWLDRYEFVLDPNLLVNGYQSDFINADNGLILLTHVIPDCRTTLAVHIRHFKDFYKGPVFDMLLAGQTACSRRCVEQSDLEICTAHCSMHWAREVLQFIRKHEVPQHLSRALVLGG